VYRGLYIKGCAQTSLLTDAEYMRGRT